MSGRRRNAWLTPNTGTGETLSRCLTFPAELLPYVTGALSALTEPWRWEQYGTMTPSDAAYHATAMLDEFVNECGVNVLLRQNETEPCILERSDDDGVTWTPFADLSLCSASVIEPEPSDYPDVRENPTTGELEFSLDGGTTWTDIPVPDGTPPTNPWTPARSPSPGATQAEQRCSAATRAANNLNAMYQQTYGAIGAGLLNTLSGINAFLRDLNNFLADIVWGEYWDIAQAVGFENNYSPTHYAAVDLGATALEALTCLLYDNATVGNLGVVSFDYGAVRDNVIAELGVNPGTAVWTHLNYVGEAGLNRLGEFGFGSTDCLSCEEPTHELYIAVNLEGSTVGVLTHLGGDWWELRGVYPGGINGYLGAVTSSPDGVWQTGCIPWRIAEWEWTVAPTKTVSGGYWVCPPGSKLNWAGMAEPSPWGSTYKVQTIAGSGQAVWRMKFRAEFQ